MIHRLCKPSNSSSFFLFGPRGTGKSFLLKHSFSEDRALRIDFLNPSTVLEYQRDPERLKRLVHSLSPNIQWLIIDEVQKVPELLDVVHGLIESTEIKFALAGSSARKLKRGAANLLAGRAFVYTLHPLTVLELNSSFNLLEQLSWGSLQRVLALTSPKDKAQYLKAYCGIYLKEEIKEEQIVRKVEPFINFLEVAAQSDGKILNYAKIANDVGVETKTVQSFFQILEDTLIGFKLESFHESPRKRQNKNPKFYFFDIGVSRALSRTINLPVQESTFEFGNRFEQLFILNCLALNNYHQKDYRFSYLRTKDGFEVDLIVERPGLQKMFIEIKSAKTLRFEDFTGLSAFAREFPKNEYRVASLDPSPNSKGNIHFVYWLELIKELFSET